MIAGLVPFLFMAAYSSTERGEEMVFHEGERVVVYALPACCQSAEYAASFKELLARLPSDAIVLEAADACACPASAAPAGAFAPSGLGLRDTTLRRTAVTGRTIVPKEPVAAFTIELPFLDPEAPFSFDLRVPPPPLTPPPPPPGPYITRWAGLFVPLLFLAGGGGDQPDPPGIICPDSGVPTGPNRERC